MTIHPPDSQAIAAALQRSQALDDAAMAILNDPVYRPHDNTNRITTSVAAASVALEHAQAVRVLIAERLPTAALSLMRLQHEALTRAVWSMYAATESELEKLAAPLSKEAEAAASGLPMLALMFKAIEKAAQGNPSAAGAYQGLLDFKTHNASALNSLVHGGIHALQRHAHGFPLPLVIQALRNCNGLLVMTAMMLAILAGNPATAKRIGTLQTEFADCLPSPLPTTARP